CTDPTSTRLGPWPLVVTPGAAASPGGVYGASIPSFAAGVSPKHFVRSITRRDADPTRAATVSWDVEFSSNEVGVAASDFSLTEGGTLSGASIRRLTGSGASYTVTASTGTGSGPLMLSMTQSGSTFPAVSGLPFDGERYL